MCDCSCTRCYFPAAACIASVIFCIVVGILLWRALVFMIHRVINRTLQRRLRIFLGLFVSGTHLPSAAQTALLLYGRSPVADASALFYCLLTSQHAKSSVIQPTDATHATGQNGICRH